jgi:hypothetical protein
MFGQYKSEMLDAATNVCFVKSEFNVWLVKSETFDVASNAWSVIIRNVGCCYQCLFGKIRSLFNVWLVKIRNVGCCLKYLVGKIRNI